LCTTTSRFRQTSSMAALLWISHLERELLEREYVLNFIELRAFFASIVLHHAHDPYRLRSFSGQSGSLGSGFGRGRLRRHSGFCSYLLVLMHPTLTGPTVPKTLPSVRIGTSQSGRSYGIRWRGCETGYRDTPASSPIRANSGRWWMVVHLGRRRSSL
jgi:hypothetical protein